MKQARRAGTPETIGSPELPAMPKKGKAELQADRLAQCFAEVDIKRGAAENAKLELVSLLKQEKRVSVVGTDAAGIKTKFKLEELVRVRQSAVKE